MADKKISEMATASAVDSDDNIELSHSVNGGFTSLKASILAIATKMLTAINFTSALETENKTVIGAINEVAQGGGGGGASELDDLDDVSISIPTNGQVLKYNSQSQEWENANESGGHNIIDSDGNEMTARSGLQFENAYVSDNSTGDKTVVPIYREMTKQEYAQAQDKTGLIVVTDDKAKVVNADSVYPVETSTSEHAYLEGDHLIVDGVTYIVIDDIAIGDSLVEGTNIEAETLATRMNHIEDGIYSASLGANLFASETKTAESATSISGNGSVIVRINCAKSGYVPISIVGYRTSNVLVFCYTLELSSTEARLDLHNSSGDAQSVTPQVTVLYRKTS